VRRRRAFSLGNTLTPWEWELLALASEGLANSEIAKRLGISETSAREQLDEILSRLDAGDQMTTARLVDAVRSETEPGSLDFFEKTSLSTVLKFGSVVSGVTIAVVVSGAVLLC
jgi:DNA-binding CsgD family transcriptional regulator